MNKKNFFKYIYLLITFLSLSFSLTACFCAREKDKTSHHSSKNNSDILKIIENGNTKFNIVYNFSSQNILKEEISNLISNLEKYEITIKTISATEESKITDFEILIGDDIHYRDEYIIDEHSLGLEGYIIKVINNKIIIKGGNDTSTTQALSFFATNYLKIYDENYNHQNITIAKTLNIEHKPTYNVSSFKINNINIGDYKILCNKEDDTELKMATSLQSKIYTYTGNWLEITETKNSNENYGIYFRNVQDAGIDGFKVSIVNNNLLIDCAYKELFEIGFNVFINEFINEKSTGNINYTNNYTFSHHISTVKYSEFGAVGDGVSDDFAKIKAAHEHANKTGQTVVADEGKTYYIGANNDTINIKTNVVWTNASFIIDDSRIPANSSIRTKYIFNVISDYKQTNITEISSLNKNQNNIGKTFDSPQLITIKYDNKKNYIRYGSNNDSGESQQEIILVDENGNVDPSTPILWDYEGISSITAIPTTDNPITITGGTFTTIANKTNSAYTYFNRGLNITRSNTTIKNIKHLIVAEGQSGAPYRGFITISKVNNVLLENIIFTAHKNYDNMGSYDLSIELSNNVICKNCTQTNDITNTNYWGIMCSNYSKNLSYIDCVLSRFDAHKGVHNATIKNSQIGQYISVIGSGTLLIENTTIYDNSIVRLRNDYGSTWNGDLIANNVTLINTTNDVHLIRATWYNHNFGYGCYLPENITIYNLTLEKESTIYIFSQIAQDNLTINLETVNGQQNLNPYQITDTVKIKNNINNYLINISPNTTLFAETELIIEK